ncbi:MAG TPA: hypothetical protein VGP07_15255 [Polyangia bacterium]|jgi:hypothetical protein
MDSSTWHVGALKHSISARVSARLLLLLGGTVYASWHFAHVWIMPGAVDPLWERGAFLAFVTLCFGLSFVPRLGGYLVEMGYCVSIVGTLHYFSLVFRNAIATPYLIGAFVILASVNALLMTLRSTIGYSMLVFALAAIVARLPSAASSGARLQLVVGVITVQLALAFSSWRNISLKTAARELESARTELKQLRGLLPICMHCNRIRAKNDAWEEIQAYVAEHTEAAFTHSICNECLQKHYPE